LRCERVEQYVGGTKSRETKSITKNIRKENKSMNIIRTCYTSLATMVVPPRGVGVRSPVRSGQVRSGKEYKIM
jgi:hypothetical protein